MKTFLNRHFLIIVSILALLFASLACNVSLPGFVNGSGNIVTESYEVDDFDQIELNTMGDVRVEQGDAVSLSIEADDNILPYLTVNVKDSRLTLDMKNIVSIGANSGTIYHVTVKSLTSLIVNSSGDFHIGKIETDSLDVSVNSSGDVNLEGITTKDFRITSNGSGDVRVNDINADVIHTVIQSSGNIQIVGSAETQTVNSSGSGDIQVDNLQTSSAEIALRSSGDAIVWAVDSLDVTIAGSGSVSYFGSPKITQSLTSSGELRSLGEK